MIYISLDVHKRFSRMGCFDPATGEVQDLGSVRMRRRPWRKLWSNYHLRRRWCWRPDGAATTWRASWSRWPRMSGSSIRER